MVDRLVVLSIRLAFKVATPEKITVIVLFNKTCYLILVVSLYVVEHYSFLDLVFVAYWTGFLSIVWHSWRIFRNRAFRKSVI